MGTSGMRVSPRSRFWITVGCFALVNVLAWAAYVHWMQPRRDLLRVERFEPGDRAVVAPRDPVRWRFNLDVAASADGAAPGKVTPAVAGRWEWPDARTLLFVPGADLSPATEYQFELSPQALRTTDDFRLAKPVVNSVMTAPLRVEQVRQAMPPQQRRYVLEFVFNDRVLPADLKSALRLKHLGKEIRFDLHGEAAGPVVRIITDTLPDAPSRGDLPPLEIELRAGLAGTSGPLGLQHPYTTQLTLETGLVCTGASAYPQPRGRINLTLNFNGQIAPDLLRRVVSVEPAVPFIVDQHWSGAQLEGDFQPATRYAIHIATPPDGEDPAKYPRPGSLSVFVPDRLAAIWFDHNEGYLGAHGNRTLQAHAVNLQAVEARVWRVYDNNLVAWRNRARPYGSSDAQPFGRPIARKTYPLSGRKNHIEDLRIELDDLLPDTADRDGVYRIALTTASDRPDDDDHDRGYYDYDQAISVITLSDIGLTAKLHGNRATVWAASLKTAKPLGAVRVRLYSSKNQLLGEAVTDASGLATIDGAQPAEGEKPAVLIAERVPPSHVSPADSTSAASGLTWLDVSQRSWDLSDLDVAGRPYHRSGLEAFLYTDRGVYRPGETVHIRGIVRDRSQRAPKAFPLRWQIRRPDGRSWRSEVAIPDADGSIGLSLPLPDDLATGRWSVVLGLPGEKESIGKTIGSSTFLIEEFLPDRMKIAVAVEPAGDAAKRTASVQADYLFGQPAAGLSADVRPTLDLAMFEPRQPQWRGWVFGDVGQVMDSATRSRHKPDWADRSQALTLDDKGHARWELDLSELAQPPAATTQPTDSDTFRGPWNLGLSASVREAGGRAVSAGSQTRIDVLPWYIGLQSTSSTVRPGEASRFNVALVKPDAVSAQENLDLEATLFRVEWNSTLLRQKGRYEWESKRTLHPVGAATPPVAIRSGKGIVTITAPAGGQYILRVRDPQSSAMTSLSFYAGDSAWDGTISREKPERLEIVLLEPAPALNVPLHPIVSRLAGVSTPPIEPTATGDPSHAYRVGQTPRALIRSPFAGTLLLTVETDSVLRTQVIDMPASQMIVPVEITDAMRPSAYISATVVRGVQPELKWRTHRAFGITRLNVDPADRKLQVEVGSPDEMRPGSPLEIALQARDSAGAAVAGASLTVAAVDEGILQLTNFQTPDPLAFFHATRALGVKAFDLYSALMPEVPKRSDIGGDSDSAPDGDRHRTPVSARRLRPVALFAGVVRTDEQGQARVHLDVPPAFAGRLRIMAVGHQQEQFGSAARDVLVKPPLIVQSSLPRFLAPGDRSEAAVTIFNNTPSAAEARIEATVENVGILAFSADGESRWTSPAAQSLPAGGQATVRLPLVARERVGVARVKILTTLGGERWEESIELPIRPAAPTITRGGYLAATTEAPAQIDIPGGLLAGTASLEVHVTPWPALRLPEGLDYLDRYPYGCAEQTISACFPLVYLGELGPRIAPGMFEKARVADKLRYGIYRLIGMQTADGGIAMWAGSRQDWPWASVYAAHLVVEAEKAGHEVPRDFRDNLLRYLRDQLDKSDDSGDVLELQAYACYVLALSGKPPRAAMNRLGELSELKGPTALPEHGYQRAQAKLYLALAWMAAGREDLAGQLMPPPRALPQPRESRQSGGNIGSPIRDRAMLIKALVELRPDDPELPALVQQLADSGQGGQWRSTQDCSFAIMAIGSYLKHLSRQPGQAYDSAELRLGEQVLAAVNQRGGELAWKGDQADAARMLAVHVSGDKARGHVSWLQNGVPLAPPAPVDNGMRVRRVYTDRDGVPLSNGRVTSGQLVRVELWVEAPMGTENLVLEDLLPAGLEIENPRLETTAAAERNWDRFGPGSGAEFVAQKLDIRDDRLVVVGEMPQTQRARYTYLARAVTPGEYILPPLRGECMYDIALNSLHGSGTLIVEPMKRAEVVGVEAR